MPSTCRTARAASAASTAPAPAVARSSDPAGPLTDYARAPRRARGSRQLDPELLDRALTHRSFAYENGGLPTNERLEFLGDSVLGVVVTETLYRTHPDLSEGRLAKLRAAVVNARALAEVGRAHRARRAHQARPRRGDHRRPQQGLDPLRHRRGGDRRRPPQRRHRGVRPGRAPALRPADGGAPPRWAPAWTGRPRSRSSSAEHALGVPEYVIEDEGPDHMKTFTAQVRVGDSLYGHGVGRSKKEAEQGAAETAYGEILASAERDAASAERRRRDRRRLMPELPEVEVVRAGLERHVLGATDRRGRGAAPAAGAPRPARPRRLRRRARPAGASRRSAAAASTSGSPSTTATPCSATSA